MTLFIYYRNFDEISKLPLPDPAPLHTLFMCLRLVLVAAVDYWFSKLTDANLDDRYQLYLEAPVRTKEVFIANNNPCESDMCLSKHSINWYVV